VDSDISKLAYVGERFAALAFVTRYELRTRTITIITNTSAPWLPSSAGPFEESAWCAAASRNAGNFTRVQ
jgi:hypothetical protein